MRLSHCWPLEGAQRFCYLFSKVSPLLPQIQYIQDLRTFYYGLKGKLSACTPFRNLLFLLRKWGPDPLTLAGGSGLQPFLSVSLPDSLNTLSHLPLTSAYYCSQKGWLDDGYKKWEQMLSLADSCCSQWSRPVPLYHPHVSTYTEYSICMAHQYKRLGCSYLFSQTLQSAKFPPSSPVGIPQDQVIILAHL